MEREGEIIISKLYSTVIFILSLQLLTDSIFLHRWKKETKNYVHIDFKFFNNPKITRFEFLLYFKQKLQESNASEWHVTNSNKIHTQTKFFCL